MRVSVIILTYARDEVLTQVLDVIRPMLGGRQDCEVILVDNNPDGIDRHALLHGLPNPTVLRIGGNKGVAARNDGMAIAKGDILALLDDDVLVQTPDFVDVLIAAFDGDPKIGAVTIRKLVRESGDTRADLIPHTRKDLDLTKPFKTFRFVGGLLALRRSAVEAVGGFSADFFYGGEEIEYAYRFLRDGWQILYTPLVVVIELEHAAGRQSEQTVQTARLTNKYIASWLHLPAPQMLVNLALFTPYIMAKSGWQVDLPKAISGFLQWRRKPDRARRQPIGREALDYMRACGGVTWR